MMKNGVYHPGYQTAISLSQWNIYQSGKCSSQTSTKCRDLAFFLDCLLKNGFHINKICGQLYPLLCNIYKIWSHINMDTIKIIIQALVVSKLDSHNSLLAGTAGYLLDKLQCIQNMACRVITNLHKYDHISENMMALHWLKIHERIMYKIVCLVYKCRCGLTPKYLQELLPRPKKKKKTRTLHSSYTTGMVLEFFKNKQLKSLSFFAVGPHIWSTLPLQVRTADTLEAFKISLKTYLCRKSYNITEGPDNSNR